MTTEAISLPRANVEPKRERRSAAHQSIGGMIWFWGWLFTIGYAKLVWWQILLGLIAWPYFLGASLSP